MERQGEERGVESQLVEARQRPVRFLGEDAPPTAAAPTKVAELIRRVYTYKKVGDLELQADVFRLSNFATGPKCSK